MSNPVIGTYYVIERRICCRICSGAKYTFPHTPDGLTLFAHHLDLVHKVTLTKYMRDHIANV